MKLEDAKALAIRTMNENGLRTDGKLGSWRFEWMNTKRALGRANSFLRYVKLSTHFVRVNDEAAVLDVIRHEVAHGIAGNHAGHGPKWKSVAAELGCTTLCGVQDDVVAPPAKWMGTCRICGRTIYRYRRTQKEQRTQRACGQCCKEFNGGKWDARFVLDWTINPEWEMQR